MASDFYSFLFMTFRHFDPNNALALIRIKTINACEAIASSKSLSSTTLFKRHLKCINVNVIVRFIYEWQRLVCLPLHFGVLT